MKIKINAPVVIGFAAISTFIFVLDQLLLGKVMPFFAVYPTLNPSNIFSIFGVFSHIFGHASLEHLLGNLTYILLLGPIIEEKFGSKNLLLMILCTALVTGLINVCFFDTALLGASGIVFMLILLVSYTNVNDREIPLTFILVAILFIGKELINSFEQNQISETAHIIGGICGSFFGYKFSK